MRSLKYKQISDNSVVKHNKLYNYLGSCMTNVLAYIWADVLSADKFKSSTNNVLMRINENVNVDFWKPQKHTRKDDLNLE